MSTRMTRFNEAQALERVANAAHEVQAASAALQQYFSPDGDAQPPMLKLVRFETAMLELSAARAHFDAVFAFASNLQGGQRDVGLLQEND
ncbi:hypothetical protein BZM27_44870 [Paraburkholderia steynii]|uniref:Uncharacterized protein n=1 Tax=Paraburkholderia steynii TaxID=1245441 RepID=A0A4R0X539_9BURK|nr:hypothetical protein BZM27_44870 [Paraburkholderia steynii]